jgi:integrase/recombinase XerD
VRNRTGIERFHVHQLRHTFACQWLERGGSLAALQQILGHASIETTQRYAKLTDEVVMREMKRLSGRVGG